MIRGAQLMVRVGHAVSGPSEQGLTFSVYADEGGRLWAFDPDVPGLWAEFIGREFYSDRGDLVEVKRPWYDTLGIPGGVL